MSALAVKRGSEKEKEIHLVIHKNETNKMYSIHTDTAIDTGRVTHTHTLASTQKIGVLANIACMCL